MQQYQLRALVRRVLLAGRRPTTPLRSPATPGRFFTRHTNLTAHGRPQLPFLSTPTGKNSSSSGNGSISSPLLLRRGGGHPHPHPHQHQQFRYLTTERRRWLAHELLSAGRYTLYFWAILGFGTVIFWSLQQEWLERRYPTPHEWRFITRMRSRLARWGPDRSKHLPETDWVQAGTYARNVLERLEDPAMDGAGLTKLDGGVEEGEKKDTEGEDEDMVAYDISAKSEPWRRGYHEALMQCARAAEHLDDQVADRTRRLVFPASQMRGPSNPHPAPIAPGSPPAPLEEDCDRAYAPPRLYYEKLLSTRGFTPRQRMDAALAYAAWLEFAGDQAAAAAMHERALACADESARASPEEAGALPPPYDERTFVLRDGASSAPPSANVLACLTALAAQRARAGDVAAALPILVSVLRARRSLPDPGASQSSSQPSGGPSLFTPEGLRALARRVFLEPPYPPPPPDGSAPPARDAAERCDEAALHLYIGEIIFASSQTKKNVTKSKKNNKDPREDGLAWTRDAVDLAEEQLQRLDAEARAEARGSGAGGGGGGKGQDPDRARERRLRHAEARRTCRECLGAGLENWGRMAARLAREEEEASSSSASTNRSGGWLGLWGSGVADGRSGSREEGGGAKEGGEGEAVGGRWAAEEQVVRERTRRVQDILDEVERPNRGLLAVFEA